MKKGRIYKIICSISNITYIGSTFNTLKGRFIQHKSASKNEKQRCSIFPFMNKYGIDKFKIILIKEYQVVDKKHLQAYEQLWINNHKNCINVANTIQMLPKHHKQVWYTSNKETHNKKTKKYYEDNREAILAQQAKTFQCDNCGKHIPNGKKARHKKSIHCRKDIQRIACNLCGTMIAGRHMARHKRTKKCLDNQISI